MWTSKTEFAILNVQKDKPGCAKFSIMERPKAVEQVNLSYKTWLTSDARLNDNWCWKTALPLVAILSTCIQKHLRTHFTQSRHNNDQQCIRHHLPAHSADLAYRGNVLKSFRRPFWSLRKGFGGRREVLRFWPVEVRTELDEIPACTVAESSCSTSYGDGSHSAEDRSVIEVPERSRRQWACLLGSAGVL